MRRNAYAIATASLVTAGAFALDAPKVKAIEHYWQDYGTGPLKRENVGLAVVRQKGTRNIFLTGPWLDYASSIKPNGGVSGTILGRKTLFGKGELDVRLEAAQTAARGMTTLFVNITCPPVSLDCNRGPVPFNVHVMGRGPITRIRNPRAPGDEVPPDSPVTLTVEGEGMSVAEISMRDTKGLWPARIIVRTANSVTIQGTSGQCPWIKQGINRIEIALRDRNDAREWTSYEGERRGPDIKC
jgi:hypothetical protein